MAGLTGLKPGNTYGQLLYIGSGNVGIEATAKQVYSGLGIASPLLLSTTQASLLGTSARIFGMTRHTTANTAGNNLTINAGGATSGATDKNGGDTYITSGIATGSGSSNIYFQTATAGAAGTADRAPSTKMIVSASGNLGINGRLYLGDVTASGTKYIAMSGVNTFQFFSAGTISFEIDYQFLKIRAASKVYFDGGSNTYIQESAADQLSIFAGGAEVCRFGYVSAGNQPALYFPEITTPTAIADMGSIYFKADNKMYCQTGDGTEHEIAFV